MTIHSVELYNKNKESVTSLLKACKTYDGIYMNILIKYNQQAMKTQNFNF